MGFPGAGARIFKNDAGEVLGWDYPSYDEPEPEYDPYDDYDNREYEEEYCDYCEKEGHTFRTCPRRDDQVEDGG